MADSSLTALSAPRNDKLHLWWLLADAVDAVTASVGNYFMLLRQQGALFWGLGETLIVVAI